MTGVQMGESLGFGCDDEEEGRWLVRGQQWWMIERRLGQGQHEEEKIKKIRKTTKTAGANVLFASVQKHEKTQKKTIEGLTAWARSLRLPIPTRFFQWQKNGGGAAGVAASTIGDLARAGRMTSDPAVTSQWCLTFHASWTWLGQVDWPRFPQRLHG